LISVNISGVLGRDVKVKSNSNSALGGDILYVGGSGANNYTKIQDAIDNASDGDTVYVYNGIYSEYFPNVSSNYHTCVDIKTSITLQGEDKEHTIINGSGKYDVITIHASDVIISGFTIQNGGKPSTNVYGRGIYNSGFDNNSYTDNIIKNNRIAMLINLNSHNIDISENTIFKNDDGIVIETGATRVEVHTNTVDNNSNGIILYYQIDQCKIHHNSITCNEIGIQSCTVESNIIEYNDIKDNYHGLIVSNCKGTIQKNNFINNIIQVDIGKAVIFFSIPFAVRYLQTWKNNYWSDWDSNHNRPIKCNINIYITIWIIRLPHYMPVRTYIGHLPSFQYDQSPVTKPYNIRELG
jgi:nitrous oxidase accessory protein NosD